jgi:hypothetical protein
MDGAVIALFDQVRDFAAVIDVRVREDHRINPAGIISKILIVGIRLRAFALIQPTFQKKARAIDLDQMLGTCYSAGRAMKVDSHLNLQEPRVFEHHTFRAVRVNSQGWHQGRGCRVRPAKPNKGAAG